MGGGREDAPGVHCLQCLFLVSHFLALRLHLSPSDSDSLLLFFDWVVGVRWGWVCFKQIRSPKKCPQGSTGLAKVL